MVYHCAAMVSFYPPDRSEMLRINVNGTGNLVKLALKPGWKHLPCKLDCCAWKAEAMKPIDETAAWIPEENIRLQYRKISLRNGNMAWVERA